MSRRTAELGKLFPLWLWSQRMLFRSFVHNKSAGAALRK